MKEITRVFHPIGQGAFYSERLIFGNKVVNVVYDCGCLSDKKKGEKIVSSAFKQSDVIDILFISHLDEDHVNEIPALIKSVSQIKCIVLPLLFKEARNFLKATYRMSKEEAVENELSERYGLLLKLLGEVNSSELLKDTRIVRISPQEGIDTESEEIKIITISKLCQRRKIYSGTGIRVADGWIFIPYNYRYEKMHKQLIDDLSQNEELYKMIKKGDIEDIISNPKKRKDLREIYQGLKENKSRITSINFNSLLLYSGPQSELYNNWSIMRIKCFVGLHNFFCMGRCINRIICCDLRNKPACIYTGDTDINVVEISSVFKNWIDIVGTIQIPHHGAQDSFDITQIPSGTICPISVGMNNTYKHPHKSVLIELLKNQCLPVLVTEDESSGFIEIIGYFPNVDF